MALFLRLDDEHNHRELRMVGDARDAIIRRLKFHALAEFRAVSAKLRAQYHHRAIAVASALRRCPVGCLRQAVSLRSARLESTEAEVLAQRVVRDERMNRSSLPNNLLARGSERSGIFIVERHTRTGFQTAPPRKTTRIRHFLDCCVWVEGANSLVHRTATSHRDARLPRAMGQAEQGCDFRCRSASRWTSRVAG